MAIGKFILYSTGIMFFGLIAIGSLLDTPQQPGAQVDEMRQRAEANLRMVERSIKQAARNPSSYETISALWSRETGSICVQYRAENGFGGMNVEHAIMPNAGSIMLNPSPTKLMKECGDEAERLY